MGKNHFETLNAMRGIAALAVVLFHSDDLFGVQIAPGGYLAVDVFFVLSGFVIAASYERRLATNMSFRAFAWLRYCRFAPLVFVAVSLGVTRAIASSFFGSGPDFSLSALVIASSTSIFLIPAPVNSAGDLFILNVPLWTLFFELVINLAYAAALPVLTSRNLIFVASVSALVTSTYILIYGDNDNGAVAGTAIAGLARSGFGFSAGVLLYRHRPRMRINFWTNLLALAVLLCFPVPPQYRALYDIVACLLIAPLLVCGGSNTEPPSRWLATAKTLGAISFPLYAIHVPIIGVSISIASRFDMTSLTVGSAVVAFICLISWTLDRFYDRPIALFLKQRSRAAAPIHQAAL